MRRIPLALLACTGLLFAIDNVELKWKFAKGATRVVSTETVMEMTMDVRGKHTTSKMTNSGDIRWTVTETNADASVVEMTYLDQKMKMENDQGADEFDSTQDKDPQNPAFVPMSKMIGKAIKLTMSSAGKVTKVEGFDQAMGDLPGGEEVVKKMIEPMFQALYPQLPDHAVTKGDSWKQEMKTPIPNLGAMAITLTFKYDGTDEYHGESCARILVAYDFSMDTTGAKVVSKIEMGKQSATMRIALDRGALVSWDSDTEYTLTAGDPQAPIVVEKMHQVMRQSEKERSK